MQRYPKSKVCIFPSFFLLIEFGPVTLIDTPGFGAEDWEFEREIVEQMVQVLKNQVKYVHVFVIAMNGNQDRFKNQMNTMLKLFGDIFSNR